MLDYTGEHNIPERVAWLEEAKDNIFEDYEELLTDVERIQHQLQPHRFEYDFPVSYEFRRYEAQLNGEYLPPIKDHYEEDMKRHMAEIDHRCQEMKFGVKDEERDEAVKEMAKLRKGRKSHPGVKMQ